MALDKIETAVWKQKQNATATILFMIRCTARVLARAPYLATYNTEKKHPVGVPSFVAFSLTQPPTEQKEMEFYLYGEAQLQKVNDSEWNLVSLRLDKSLSSEEDSTALFAAAQA